MLGIGYTLDLGAPVAWPNSVSTIWQLTAGSGNPFDLHRFKIQSASTGGNQTVVQLQFVILSTTGSGGAGPTPTKNPLNPRITTAAAVAAASGYTTLGTVSKVLETYQWNVSIPLDLVNGKDILLPAIAAAGIFAINFLAAPGSGLTITSSIQIEEG